MLELLNWGNAIDAQKFLVWCTDAAAVASVASRCSALWWSFLTFSFNFPCSSSLKKFVFDHFSLFFDCLVDKNV
jgi:hypothetical protein